MGGKINGRTDPKDHSVTAEKRKIMHSNATRKTLSFNTAKLMSRTAELSLSMRSSTITWVSVSTVVWVATPSTSTLARALAGLEVLTESLSTRSTRQMALLSSGQGKFCGQMSPSRARFRRRGAVLSLAMLTVIALITTRRARVVAQYCDTF